MIGIGPGVVSRDALVAFGIEIHRLLWRYISDQLGLHPLESGLERRIDRMVPSRILLIKLGQGLDALARKRMGAVVAVFRINPDPELLVLELLEELEASLAGDTGRGKIFGARKVGSRFLGPAKGHEAAHRRLLAGRQDSHAGLACARRHRSGAQHKAQDRNNRCFVDPVVNPDRMPSGNVTQFVRDYALELIDVVGGGQKSAVDIDNLPLRDEGIDLRIVDQDDLDALGVQACGFDERIANLLEQQLGFAVAQQRLSRCRLSGGEEQHQPKH